MAMSDTERLSAYFAEIGRKGEVHYDEQGRITAWTENSVGPVGETYGELTADFAHFQQAFTKPVIAIEPNGLFEIGPMGNSVPKQVWAKEAKS